MEQEELIAVEVYCTQNEIEIAFIDTLAENGLIEVMTIQETRYIPVEKLHQLEKLTRLHYDLDINCEGIEAITFLLQKIESMQDEIALLKNRLSLYENY